MGEKKDVVENMEKRGRYSITMPAGNSVTRELTAKEAAVYQLQGFTLRQLNDLQSFGPRSDGQVKKKIAQLEQYFKLDSKCNKCQTNLGADDYRVVFTVVQLWGGSVAPRTRLTFCGPCATTVPNFDVPNPVYMVTPADIPADVREQEALEEVLSLRTGKPFVEIEGDLDYPVWPGVAVKREDGEKIGDPKTEKKASDEEGWIVEKHGREDGKRHIRTFLSSPYSKGLRLGLRKAAELLCEGKTQNEIATTLGVSQATVSKMIRAVKAESGKALATHHH